MKGVKLGFLLVGVGVASIMQLLPKAAQAAVFRFSPVADTSTLVPGGTGSFDFFDTPTIGGDATVFEGGQRGGEFGLYRAQGGSIQTLVNANTPIPNGNGNFAGISGYASSDQGVAFIGYDSEFQPGVFWADGKTLQRIGPIDNANYFEIQGLATKGQTVVYGGSPYALDGQRPPTLFLFDGNDTQVPLSSGIPIPGAAGQTFTEFAFPALSEDSLAFVGSNFTRGGGPEDLYGVYVLSLRDGTLQAIADTNTPTPGGEGTFGQYGLVFGAPSIEGSEVSFTAKTGIYRSDDQILSRVVDLNTLIPGTDQTFNDFGQSVIRGNQIVFQAGSSNFSGIYTSVEDNLAEVIATGSQIQGKTVSYLQFGSSSWSGDRLVFGAGFDDGSRGIFEAQPVPAPASTLGLAVLGAVGAGSLVQRRLKQRQARKLGELEGFNSTNKTTEPRSLG
jgi:hypothetical protein